MKRMDATGCTIRFVAVLEVEPYLYSTRPCPELVDPQNDPGLWDRYFLACLADIDVHDVVPFESNFVLLADLARSSFLARLVADRVTGPGFGALCGGLCMTVDERVIFSPTCCADLGDLKGWEEAVASPGATWIWRGHPRIACEVAEGKVVLSEEWEGSPVPEDLDEVCASVEQLTRALADVRLDVERFCAELERVTRKHTNDDAEARAMARALCGLAL